MTQATLDRPFLLDPSDPLLGYQKRWVADKTPVKLFTKSRRIGISWTEASDCALLAAKSAAAGGMNVTYICYDKDITRQFIVDCAFWAGIYSLAASEISQAEEVWKEGKEEKSVLVFEVKFSSGFTIQAIAGNPRKLRGRKGRVVIDEAAFLDHFAEALESALALLIWGGDIHIITTYNGIENEYYDLEKEVLSGKYPYSRHFCTFDDAVKDGLFQRICQASGRPWSLEAEFAFIAETRANFGDRAMQELDCVPKGGGGKYFHMATLERCMTVDCPILTYRCADDFAGKTEGERTDQTNQWLRLEVEPVLASLDQNLRSVFGMDFARSGDASVLLPLQEGKDLRWSCPFGLELRNVPYEQQRQIVFFVGERLPRFTFAAIDSTGNGGYIGEVCWQKWGEYRIHKIMLNRPFYAEWYPRYRAALEELDILLPRSANWRDDHRMVELDKGVPLLPGTTIKGTDGLQRHGDSATAGLLANYAKSQPWAEPGWKPAENPATELPDNFWEDFGGGAAW